MVLIFACKESEKDFYSGMWGKLLPLIPYIWYDLTGDKLKEVREDMAERRAVISAQVSGGAENE